mgnify:CR=1 FL=1
MFRNILVPVLSLTSIFTASWVNAEKRNITNPQTYDVKIDPRYPQSPITNHYGVQLAQTFKGSDIPANYIAERKYDGFFVFLMNGKLIARSGRDITYRFPEITIPSDMILVAELIITKAHDMSDFSMLQTRSTNNLSTIKLLSEIKPAHVVLHDVLEIKGRSVAQQPQSERRKLLESLNLNITNMSLSLQFPPNIKLSDLLKTEAALGGEGVMLKDTKAPYAAGRNSHMLKAKTWQERTFLIKKYEITKKRGFIITVKNQDRLQRVVVNDQDIQSTITQSAKPTFVEVQFLSESKTGALRFPSIRTITNIQHTGD